MNTIWNAANEQTEQGYACNTGQASCPFPVKGKMVLVKPSAADKAMLDKLLVDVILPKWAARCSAQCVADFNATIGKKLNVVAKK